LVTLQNISLSLRNEEGHVVSIVKGEFTSDDFQMLNQYIASMSRLRETALVKRGIPMISNMSWSAGNAMSFTCDEYSNPELYELLHVSRHLILESEPASFHKTLALLGRKFADQTYKSHQKYIRKMFEDGELSMYMQISLGGQNLLDESLLKIWLNGTQYHGDTEKAAAWEQLESSLTTKNARAIVSTQLHSRVKAMALLEHDVKLITTAQSPTLHFPPTDTH
jgi:hypothetical protein